MSLLSKTLLAVGLLLLALKSVARRDVRGAGKLARLKELGRRLDRAINVVLVLLLIWYVAYAVWWVSKGGPP